MAEPEKKAPVGFDTWDAGCKSPNLVGGLTNLFLLFIREKRWYFILYHPFLTHIWKKRLQSTNRHTSFESGSWRTNVGFIEFHPSFWRDKNVCTQKPWTCRPLIAESRSLGRRKHARPSPGLPAWCQHPCGEHPKEPAQCLWWKNKKIWYSGP